MSSTAKVEKQLQDSYRAPATKLAFQVIFGSVQGNLGCTLSGPRVLGVHLVHYNTMSLCGIPR